MSNFARIFLLFLVICLAERAQASRFGIVEPFPKNIYPLQYTSVQVTCVAFDSEGVKVPSKILFMRRDKFDSYVELKAHENLFFENKAEIIQGNKTKLFVTLFIRNVTLDYDSLYGVLGSYECQAFAVGDVNKRGSHGFSVSVITRLEIPKVHVVPDISVLQHDDDITLICNITERSSLSTPLKRISWFKDGKALKSVRNPDPQNSQDTLGPLKLTDVSVRDGGKYTCLLEVLLRNVKKYNVSDATMIHIATWFPKPKEDVEEKGINVSFECAARGFPLEPVEWKVKRKDKDTVQSCINGSSGHYKIHRDSVYDPYILTISDVQYTDRGFYYCCLSSNCSDNVKDNCQRFILHVTEPKDPKGGTMTLTSHGVFAVLAIFVMSFLCL